MRTYAILGNVRIAYIFFQKIFAYGQTQKYRATVYRSTTFGSTRLS